MAFAGYWLDRLLGTLPLFLIAGVFVGFAGGMLSMVRRVGAARAPRPDELPPGRDGDRS